MLGKGHARKHRFAAVCIGAFLMALIGPVAAFALQPGTSIYGMVTDAQSGQPISGSVVSAYSSDAEETVTTSTDSLGRYELAAPAGTYEVTCYVSNRYEQKAVSGVAADPSSPTDLSFSVNPYGKAFYGLVTDAATGLGVPGAAVIVESTSGSFTTLVNANAQGGYEVYAPVGTYDVGFAATGYQRHVVAGQIFSGTAVELNNALTALVTSVYGSVTNASSGDAIAGALVVLSWSVPDPQPEDPDNVEIFEVSTSTNVSGAYRFTEPAGHYQVRAVSYGFVPSTPQDAVFDGTHSVLRDFALAPKTKAIAGKVVESGTNTPLAASVQFVGTIDGEPIEEWTSTNAQGDYAAYLAAGTYDVSVSAAGHLMQTATLTFDGATTTTRDFALAPAGADDIEPVTVLSGVPAGWSNSDVTFTLSASDLGGAGVVGTYYQLGVEGDAVEYVDPVTMTSEGSTQVTYWSIDADGNREANKTALVQIDKTSPSTACDVSSTYVDIAKVTLVPSDSGGSAIKTTKWRLDSSPTWSTGTLVTTAVPGLHTLEFYSEDNAGNAEPTKTRSFTVAAASGTLLTIKASSVAPSTYRQPVTLTGSLRQSDGASIPGAQVSIQTFNPSLGGWTVVARLTTAANGAVTWATTPTSTTTYRFVFDGTSSAAASASASVTVIPKAYISKVNTSRYASRTYKLTGTLKPEHASGTYPVRIYRWKKTGGKWVAKGYLKAKVADYRGYSRYSAKYKFPSKGAWRLQALSPKDASHQTSKSGYTYCGVK